MMLDSNDFLEGFIAAARTFGLDLAAAPERLLAGTHLTMDDYLAIPTFIRQGRGIAALKASGFIER